MEATVGHVVLSLLLALLFSFGCAETLQVREADLDAWANIPVIELQLHPFFSTLSLEKKSIGQGYQLWNHLNCVGFETSYYKHGSWSEDVCCDHQFLVYGGKVVWYRPLGNCYTDCFRRPKGYCGDLK